MEVEIKNIKTSSAVVPCAVFGSGKKAFVILPGLSLKSVISSAHEVARAYKAFAETHTVYLIDRRQRIDGGITIGDIADDTAEAMRLLGISGADVFAASFGGMVAQLLAINYPELVDKLVLGSSCSRVTPHARAVIDRWCALAESKECEALCRDFISRVYSEAFNDKYGEMLVKLMSDCTDEDLAQFVYTARSCRNFDVTDSLDGIVCPVLVIGAENDRVLTADAARETADILDSKIYIYPSPYSHAVYDEAEDYKQRLMDYFEGD